MTEQKEKILVAMVLAHDELLCQHGKTLLSNLKILTNLAEDNRPLQPYIESMTERFEAVDRDKTELRKNLREAFGLA